MIWYSLLGGLAALLLLRTAQAPVLAAELPTETVPGASQLVQPQAFRTPEEGFTALVAATRAHDEGALLRILGSAGRHLIRSGDRVADRAARDAFAAAYATRKDVLRPASDLAELHVGADDWPLPIPMSRRGSTWRFDAAAGVQEIVNRRIGRDELDTIETLRAIVDAQDDYARTAGRHGALRAYARRFFSSPGQRDGLYWSTDEGEAQSPLGPLVAAASAGGYGQRQRGKGPQPYHGYVFRILERQGPSASGGATDYLVNGRMIGGFAVIASPAQYGSTGIKTFMISHHGTVWERDLGPDTARAAAAITSFNPGPGWDRLTE